MASTVSDNVAQSSEEIANISDNVAKMDLAGDSKDVKEVRNHF
jgi:hypothetical protein